MTLSDSLLATTASTDDPIGFAQGEPPPAPEPELTDAEIVAFARAHAREVMAQLEARYAGDDRFVFDERAAQRACDFFPRFLRHSIGDDAGKPFALEEWQLRLVRLVFGWKWRTTAKRVIRRVYLFVARKNGKSTFVAGLAWLMLVGDGEHGAQVYSAAADREQASIVFDEAVRMRDYSPALTRVTEAYKTAIVCSKLSAAYKVLAKPPSGEAKHGFNPHAVLFDELHAQPNRDLYDALHTAVGARSQPLEVYPTTAGYDRHSICYEVHKEALQILDGSRDDPSFLPVLFCADDDDDWQDPRAWAKANPSIGVAVKLAFLRQMAREAAGMPARQNTFRRLHLNQWTEQVTRWIPPEQWDACTGAIAWRDMEAGMAGRRAILALDLSTTTDLTARVLLFEPTGESDVWHLAFRFFVPKETLRRRSAEDGVPYDLWADDGAITPTEGNRVDYKAVVADTIDCGRRFTIAEVGIDPWNSSAVATDLQDAGVKVVEVSQTIANLSAPTKLLETLVYDRKIAHGGHPVMAWMMRNVALRTDHAENIKPDKDKSGDRIDGVVATIVALARAQSGEVAIDIGALIEAGTAIM